MKDVEVKEALFNEEEKETEQTGTKKLDVNLLIEKGKKGKPQESGTLGNSFDTDDYFEAALKRSFRQSLSDEESESSKS